MECLGKIRRVDTSEGTDASTDTLYTLEVAIRGLLSLVAAAGSLSLEYMCAPMAGST